MPTLISVLDFDIDVTVFYNVTEEESNQKEVTKTFEVFVFHSPFFSSLTNEQDAQSISDSYSNHYNPFDLEDFSPPPESILV